MAELSGRVWLGGEKRRKRMAWIETGDGVQVVDSLERTLMVGRMVSLDAFE